MQITLPGWEDRIKEYNDRIMRVMMLSMGGWDLSTQAQKILGTPFEITTIVSISVLFLSDNLNYVVLPNSETAGGYLVQGESQRILINRPLALQSDPQFSSTANTRGYVIVWYVGT